MWPPWGKSSSSSSSTRRNNFSCSSFKDIQTLFPEQPQPKKPSLFRRVRFTTSIIRAWSSSVSVHPKLPPPPPPPTEQSNASEESTISLPGTEKCIVIYFTSLRIVRKTFEDCKTVRSIFRGFRVSIDERDLSMDGRFLEELQGILGVQKKNQLTLPRVFIGGRYIGGADEIKHLHETGELKNFLQGFPTVVESGVCDECGGYRFLLCYQCNGSHKFYLDKGEGGFRTCSACNENGLIRCPTCSSFTP